MLNVWLPVLAIEEVVRGPKRDIKTVPERVPQRLVHRVDLDDLGNWLDPSALAKCLHEFWAPNVALSRALQRVGWEAGLGRISLENEMK